MLLRENARPYFMHSSFFSIPFFPPRCFLLVSLFLARRIPASVHMEGKKKKREREGEKDTTTVRIPYPIPAKREWIATNSEAAVRGKKKEERGRRRRSKKKNWSISFEFSNDSGFRCFLLSYSIGILSLHNRNAHMQFYRVPCCIHCKRVDNVVKLWFEKLTRYTLNGIICFDRKSKD